MRRHVMTVITAAFLAVICAVPTFAHCHGRREQRTYCYNNACESYCEDGYLCGVDGHYCDDHRDGDANE